MKTLAVVSLMVGLAGPMAAFAAATPVDLGAASSFAVLAGTPFIANTGNTVITGNVGLSPATGAGITGFSTVTMVGTSTIYAVDAAGPAGSVSDPALLTAAKNALTAAYLNVAGQTPVSTIGSELGGQTLDPGVYDSADTTFHITGTLTLDAHNDPNAIFVFKAGSTLTTAASSSVVLINQAQACNVYWQLGSSAATLGTNSIFKGNILVLTSITLTTGANVEGRVLARNGAVTLDANVITVPACTSPAPATLHVIKLVANATHAAVASDFMVHVRDASGTEVGGGPFPGATALGTAYTLPVGGTYVVSEDANALYSQSFTGACNGTSSVTLAAGDNICTIVNTDIPLPVVSTGGGGGGTGGGRIVPLIGLLKVPTPLALSSGTGQVAYGYTVWNVGGQQALIDVSVADDKCGPVTLLSGDLNGNNKLDPGENWKYRCTATLSTTTTNTAVATGYSDDVFHQAAIATALATVVVGSPLPPPLINIVKVPSRLTPFPLGGGNVTYAYTVTNPGVVAMHNVTVTDDKCGPVSRTGGDANNNNLLDPGEAWTYACTANVAVSTRNVATAAGQANGFTAIGYAFATVLVAVPGLPNTGFPPEISVTLQDVLVLVCLLAISAFLLYITRKKQTA